MKIKNFDDLATTPLRKAALEIAEAGLQAIDTQRVIRDTVLVSGDTLTLDGERIPFAGIGRIIVAGIGKCAGLAAAELENILGDRLSGGLVITIGDVPPLTRIKNYPGTHPFPSQENMDASKALLESLSGLKENDLVIFLVTGGGSTLLCLPDDGNWERESLILNAFMNAGAPIEDINTARKHMSLVRGGFLAQAMYPARVVSLIFNDVPGSDDIGFIASGPTVKDATTIADAQAVLDEYKIFEACQLDGCGLMETPKGDKYFARVKNITVVSNMTALAAMKQKAEERGYRTEIVDAKIAGEARGVGQRILEELRAASSKSALLYGGETTVAVRGKGRGGRNLELALSALADIGEGELITSVASDGRDNGEFAGAICDIMTKKRAGELGLDIASALRENDTYPFFEKAGNYLLTGATGSNVSDLIIAIKD